MKSRTHMPAAKVIEKERKQQQWYSSSFNMHDSILYTHIHRKPFSVQAQSIHTQTNNGQREKIVYQIIIRIITIFFSHSLSLFGVFFLFKFHYSRRTFLTHLFGISLVVDYECVYGRLFVCFFFVIVSWLRRISGIQFHILFSLHYFIASLCCDHTNVHTRTIGENVHFCFIFWR